MSWGRPKILNDPETVAACARRMGMKPREVLGYFDADGGRVILTHDGQMTIDIPADHPDAMGHTGLAYYPQAGLPVPSSVTAGPMPVYCDSIDEAADPRTLRDLQARCLRDGVSVPAMALTDPHALGAWVGGDPVRACAVWQQQAAKLEVGLQAAPEKSQVAARMRVIILAAGIAA